MLLNEKINIKVSKKNITHLQSKGYECKLKDIIEINTLDINTGCHISIKVKCDVCGTEKEIPFQKYIKNINNGNFYACSSKCAQDKVKKTNMDKFGEEYYAKTKRCKERIKEISLKKYGCEHFTQNENIKNKVKNTNIKKYGVDNPFKSKEIKEKIKKTNIEKYGVDNPFKSDEIKEKIKQTSLKRYGVDKPSKNKEIIQKTEKTNLERYGVKNYLNLDWVKNKAKIAYFDKYGVNLGNMTNDMKEKMKENKKNKWINTVLNNYPNLKLLSIDSSKEIYHFKCEKGHDFEIPFKLLIQRHAAKTTLCTICNPIEKHISGLECQLSDFIKENYDGEIIENKKILLSYEIDIYLPQLKLGFEFNGLFWHCEMSKKSNYHLNKTEIAESMGIKLIHVYEDDWIFRKEIVKATILDLLNKSKKIYVDECEIKETIDSKEVKYFLDKNHIKGFIGSQIKLGLYYQNELVSLMTFSKIKTLTGNKNERNDYEILRFCNEIHLNVIGSADKLLNEFIKRYNPKNLISYVDRGWENSILYEKSGFKLIQKISPDYYYIIDKYHRSHHFNYRKNELVREGADSNKTVHEIMLEKGQYRIYDSGSLKYQLNCEHFVF